MVQGLCFNLSTSNAKYRLFFRTTIQTLKIFELIKYL